MRFGRRDRQPAPGPDEVRRARQARIAAALDAAAETARGAREQEAGQQGEHQDHGITHSGPETLEIHGQVLGHGNTLIDGDRVSGGECGVPPRAPGRSGPAREYISRTRGQEPRHGPYVVNSGRGSVNVDRSVFGDGITVVNGAETEAGE